MMENEADWLLRMIPRAMHYDLLPPRPMKSEPYSPGAYITMKLAGIILVALVALVASACSGKPYVVKPAPELSDTIRSHPVFVVSHGWHTGLIIPAGFLDRTVPDLRERFGDAAYYEIGWGDRGFYQAQEITTGLTLQAMFWSEGAVMHVVGIPGSPGEYFADSEVVGTCLTAGEMSSLSTFVSSSFAHDSDGYVIRRKNGIYGNSQFYDGEGRYYLLNTCNKWTAKGLLSAGVEISPSVSLTSESVMRVVRAREQQCTLPPASSR